LPPARDFGCDPRRSEYLFFDNPVILKVNTRRDNLLEMMVDGTLSPSDINRDYHYVAAGDPAYRINAFGIALAHGVSEIDWIDNELITEAGIRQFLEDFPFSGVVVDGLWRFEPSENPIKPDKVLDFFLDMVEHWEVGHVGFDIWQYPSIHQALNEYGVEVYTEQLKKEDFDNMKDLLALGRLDICNYPYVLDEMSKLLLNNTETKVIKPKNASKDVTDALVHTVKLLIEVDWSEPNLMQYFVKTA
jgi:hypothetical protein